MAEKIGFLKRTEMFFGEVRTELTKVDWPTFEQVKNYTIVVLGTTAVVAVLIFGWDTILGFSVDKIFGLHG